MSRTEKSTRPPAGRSKVPADGRATRTVTRPAPEPLPGLDDLYGDAPLAEAATKLLEQFPQFCRSFFPAEPRLNGTPRSGQAGRTKPGSGTGNELADRLLAELEQAVEFVMTMVGLWGIRADQSLGDMARFRELFREGVGDLADRLRQLVVDTDQLPDLDPATGFPVRSEGSRPKGAGPAPKRPRPAGTPAGGHVSRRGGKTGAAR